MFKKEISEALTTKFPGVAASVLDRIANRLHSPIFVNAGAAYHRVNFVHREGSNLPIATRGMDEIYR